MGNKLPKNIREMNVNWIDVDDMVSVTAYQKKMIKQLMALAESHPDEVRIVAVNEDGTIVVHLPKKYAHVSFYESSKREMTEDQKVAAAERLKKMREKKAEKKAELDE